MTTQRDSFEWSGETRSRGAEITAYMRALRELVVIR